MTQRGLLLLLCRLPEGQWMSVTEITQTGDFSLHRVDDSLRALARRNLVEPGYVTTHGRRRGWMLTARGRAEAAKL